jgi:nucleotide-binding universal stress UspA family protein
MFKRILIAIDDGEPAAAALSVGMNLALELKAELALLNVVDVSLAPLTQVSILDEDVLAYLRQSGQRLLEQSALRIPRSIAVTSMLREGDPADVIVKVARTWNADGIVLGSETRGRLAQFLLGSTADAVVRKAHCPVWTVRETADRAGNALRLAAEIAAQVNL